MQEITKAELLKLIDRPKPVILDIGAYDGADSFEFAKLGCKVHAFEPILYNRRMMRRHDNILVYPYAIGREEHVSEFYNATEHTQSGSLREPKNHLKVWPHIKYNKTKVQVFPLDAWYKDVCTEGEKTIDLAWIDVNGSEADLIAGAEKTLKNTRFLFIETSDKELFEGQVKTEKLLKLLPDWKELGFYNYMGNYGNLLLKNGRIAD